MALNADLEPSPDRSFLGINVGGTKTALILGTGDGLIRQRAAFETGAGRGPTAVLAEIIEHVDALRPATTRLQAIGVSIGGPVDAENGGVLGPPNLPGWDDLLLAAMLRRRFGAPVGVEHDAKTWALAEWRSGAGRGSRDMVFLTLGTGIGAGIIAGGRLVRGRANLAGEIGHWRVAGDGPGVYGKRGSLEGWASGAGLPALARHLGLQGFGEGAEALGLRASRGDAGAMWQRATFFGAPARRSAPPWHSSSICSPPRRSSWAISPGASVRSSPRRRSQHWRRRRSQTSPGAVASSTARSARRSAMSPH